MDKHKKTREHDEKNKRPEDHADEKHAHAKESEQSVMPENGAAGDAAGRDAEISRLKQEIESLKDVMMRRQADFENFKKRNAKMYEDQKKMSIKDFALDIILINDDLIRAIDASSGVCEGDRPEEAKRSLVDGVTMISKRIEETLGKYGIVEVDSLNREFDPNFNEAVEIEMSPDVDRDTVTKVYLKGFRIDDLNVRSARVRVAKPVKKEEQKPPEAGTSSGPENVENATRH
ncbi:MAG: nucleotide exchange factor GrpE [Spirochaetes bacterium]|nr:nucleotide exchange factor GrpE [Spirochaetota bacterium]